MLSASTERANTAETLAVLRSEFNEFSRGRIGLEELEFARHHLLRSLPFMSETAAQEVAQELQGALLGYPEGHLAAFESFLSEPRHEQVRDTLCALLDHRALSTVLVCTVTPSLVDEVRSVIGDEPLRVISYKDALKRGVL